VLAARGALVADNCQNSQVKTHPGSQPGWVFYLRSVAMIAGSQRIVQASWESAMHEIMRFSSAVRKKLGFYVYLYIDPRDNKPFYIGKGRGNRAFSHLRVGADSKKARILNELSKLGLHPTVEILKYGLTEKEALLVESTAIDLLDIRHLANNVRGHGSRHGSRGSVQEIQTRLDAKEANIDCPAVLINITQKLPHDVSIPELYDATRSAWRVGADRCDKAKIAICVYRKIIREAFSIAAWLRDGATMRANDPLGERIPEPDRFEFVGRVADSELRRKLVGRSVAQHFPPGSQNPIKYMNC
jgi:hypothetical protein